MSFAARWSKYSASQKSMSHLRRHVAGSNRQARDIISLPMTERTLSRGTPKRAVMKAG